MDCPRCNAKLEATSCDHGRMLTCPACGGSALTVEFLRRFAEKERIDRLWRSAQESHGRGPLSCPDCGAAMRRVPAARNGLSMTLDVCLHSQLIWFDADELGAFSPERQSPASGDERQRVAAGMGIDVESPRVSDELWRMLGQFVR